LKVLLVSVPQPTSVANLTFQSLPAARTETEQVTKLLKRLPGIETTLLRDDKAIWDNVMEELGTGPYQIFHFIGHVHFHETNPRDSALILHDRAMSPGQIHHVLESVLLCFLNACDSSRTDGNAFKSLGLARSILEAGPYLLGSRWRLSDAPASRFAP